MKLLLTGVAICRECGRTWELYRVRAEEAFCARGASLSCVDENSAPKPPVCRTESPE